MVLSGRDRGVAQPGSATALGAVGREFESLHPDQFQDASGSSVLKIHEDSTGAVNRFGSDAVIVKA